jgi:hypothetical protein
MSSVQAKACKAKKLRAHDALVGSRPVDDSKEKAA